MRAVGLAELALAGDQGGMRNWEKEGMSECWRGGPLGTGGRPYRRGAGSLVLLLLMGSRREETLPLCWRVADADAEGVERGGGQ
jgi:hypothetical protein